MALVGVVGVGVVGGRVVRALHSSTPLAVHDRRLDAAHALARDVDVDVLDTVESLERCQTVVLAHPAPHAGLAARLLRAGINVISVVGDGRDVSQLVDLDELARSQDASLVVGAAMSPGLSGLMARWLSTSLATVDEVHVAMHGTAGPACAREHHRALGSRAVGWNDGDWTLCRGGSGRELCWFPEPVGAYDCYRADVIDPILLHDMFPSVNRISARVSANRRDRFTAWLPMLRPPHPEGGVGALRVEVRGASESAERVTVIGGIAELVGTATAAVAATFAEQTIGDGFPPGVVIPGEEALPTTRLLGRIADLGVRMQSFTGVPTPS